MANVSFGDFVDPFERLGVAMVMSAARDLQSNDTARRAAARRWLRGDRSAPVPFAAVCALLNADREFIRSAIERRAGAGSERTRRARPAPAGMTRGGG